MNETKLINNIRKQSKIMDFEKNQQKNTTNTQVQDQDLNFLLMVNSDFIIVFCVCDCVCECVCVRPQSPVDFQLET
jgi:hypothetical protein